MPDNGGQVWDLRLVWHGKPRAEVIPEGDAELGAVLVEAEKGIAAIATRIASGAAAHFSFGDLTADIVLRSIGVQRNLGPIGHHQQFFFAVAFAQRRTRVSQSHHVVDVIFLNRVETTRLMHGEHRTVGSCRLCDAPQHEVD